MENINFELDYSNSNALKWYTNGSVYCKGYAFDSDSNLYKNNDLVGYFEKVKDEKSFKKALNSLNGFFVILIKLENLVLGAVDYVRSIPLFIIESDTISITDNVTTFNNTSIDELSVLEFISIGYTSGNSTLQRDVKQLLAGQYFVLKNQELKIDFYYKHIHSFNNNQPKKKYYNDLNKISENIFNRLKEFSKNKTLVIPLSGGFDSRYIAAYIRKLGIKDVICYTYGKKDSFEVATSKRVADTLGFSWYFIEYTDEKWKMALDSNDLKEYNFFGSNFSSLSHYQEFIALKELKERKVIPDDAIFIPGFSGDMLGGSLLPQSFYFKEEKNLLNINLNEYIYNKYIDNNALNLEKNKTKIIKRIKNSYTNNEIQSPDDFVNAFEEWFLLQRIGKYINNALRIYEYFGYNWIIPLWDKELFEYWYTIPNEHRIQSKLYNDYLMEKVFKPLNIDYKKLDDMEPNKIRNFIKKIVTRKLITKFRTLVFKFTGRNDLIDINNYNYFASQIYNRVEQENIKLEKNIHINRLYAIYTLIIDFRIDIKKFLK